MSYTNDEITARWAAWQGIVAQGRTGNMMVDGVNHYDDLDEACDIIDQLRTETRALRSQHTALQPREWLRCETEEFTREDGREMIRLILPPSPTEEQKS